MKPRYVALTLGLISLPAILLVEQTNSAAPAREPASEVVRKMADYLETSPKGAVMKIAELSVVEEPASGGADPARLADATESGVEKVEEIERRISQHYPQTEAGTLIRHFVALTLADVDTDYRPDLSRVRAINDLMQNAGTAAMELAAALGSLAPDDAGAEAERAALIKLVTHVGANESALATAETLLATEINRHAALDAGANAARMELLVDSYTMLVSDPRKQVEFLRAGIQAQEDTGLREVLESRLETLGSPSDASHVDLTQAQPAPADAT